MLMCLLMLFSGELFLLLLLTTLQVNVQQLLQNARAITAGLVCGRLFLRLTLEKLMRIHFGVGMLAVCRWRAQRMIAQILDELFVRIAVVIIHIDGRVVVRVVNYAQLLLNAIQLVVGRGQ